MRVKEGAKLYMGNGNGEEEEKRESIRAKFVLNAIVIPRLCVPIKRSYF